jgi:anti-anti-sigma factor
MQPADFTAATNSALHAASFPAGMGLKIQAAGRSVVVRVAGPFDLETATRLSAGIAASSRTSRRVLLDLSQASYIDSPGVRALLQLQSELTASRRELRLAIRRGSSVDRTFGLLRLEDQLAVSDSVAGAWTPQRSKIA